MKAEILISKAFLSIKSITNTIDTAQVLEELANILVTTIGFGSCSIFHIKNDVVTIMSNKGREVDDLASSIVLDNYKEAVFEAKSIVATRDHKEAYILRSLLYKPDEYYVIYTKAKCATTSIEEKRNVIDVFGSIIFTKIEHYKMKTLLSRSNEQMKSQINSQVEEIKATNKELEKSTELLKQFRYCVSHDLREPIRNIVTYNSLAKRAIDKGSSQEKLALLLEDSLSQSYRLDKMVDEIKHSFTGDKQLIIETLMIERIYDDVVNNLKVLIKENNAKISVGNSMAFESSFAFLKIILQNLISNAIYYKAADRDPEIVISVETHQDHDLIHVEDNGRGIEKHDFERIFLPYERGDVGRNGTGLGLTTCNKLCEYLSAELSVNSIVGKGSIFTIKLPKSQIKTIELHTDAGETQQLEIAS